jgi:hypothetical protein
MMSVSLKPVSENEETFSLPSEEAMQRSLATAGLKVAIPCTRRVHPNCLLRVCSGLRGSYFQQLMCFNRAQ